MPNETLASLPQPFLLYSTDFQSFISKFQENCDMCFERLEKGLNPMYVLNFSMRALEFGPLEDLNKKYGHLRRTDLTLICPFVA
jgi:Fe-S-cluster-containing dehydrogenase component